MSSVETTSTPESLASLSTDELKTRLLDLVKGQDELSVSKKVRFFKERLAPYFDELEKRNPTPDVHEQIPLVQGTWLSVWSTIPFQDILPGRVRSQSYQIFADNGYYANLARYRPGRKTPILSWFAKRLLSYDLMILQTYAVGEGTPEDSAQQTWEIENIGIQQKLKVGAIALSPANAQNWFDQAMAEYKEKQDNPLEIESADRATRKKYEGVYKAKPQLEHLYIDKDFRLVLSRREKSQRPSYTITTRIT